MTLLLSKYLEQKDEKKEKKVQTEIQCQGEVVKATEEAA